MGPRVGLDKCGKSRPPTGIRSPDSPARSSVAITTTLHKIRKESILITVVEKKFLLVKELSLISKQIECILWHKGFKSVIK